MTTTAPPDLLICEPGGGGLVFPLIESEQTWDPFWRSLLYITALCYIFLGVAIVADKFMESIEMITSTKYRTRNLQTGKYVTKVRWNATMANLTLLALGSSAPEILLSIMEICIAEFHSGALGPSTIVGSAAFNLFVIIAVCVSAIPSNEPPRFIKEYNVFVITAVFSIIAYLWLVLIVQVTSPDVVEIWEAVVTLLMFPVLLIISYLADIGYFDNMADKNKQTPMDAKPLPVQLQRALTWPPDPRKGQPVSGAGFGTSGGEQHDPVLYTDGKVIENMNGVLTFAEEAMEVLGESFAKKIQLTVIRCNGQEGTVSCQYRTDNKAGGGAIPGKDYTQAQGELTFGPNQKRQDIEIEILPKKQWECADSFQVVLEEPSGGAVFNPHDDGGKDSCILTVKIQNGNEKGKQKFSHLAMHVVDGAFNVDRTSLGFALWKDAIVSSVMDDGSEEGEPLSFTAKILAIISIPWSFVFAVIVPPAEYCGGWACFFMALAGIGGITTIIIDFAGLFGCVTGTADSITAITFVALGTSMPDLFASKTAAVQDECADASIVNVTGSNSVNVFLGIGIPWLMAAIYWALVSPTELWLARNGADFGGAYPNGAFVVRGGDLGFSVIVFIIAASIAFLILRLRRTHIGGELGGPQGTKSISSILLFLLWVFYIVLSIWKVGNPDASFGMQVLVIIIAVVMMENLALVVGGILKITGFFKEAHDDTHPQTLEEGFGPDHPSAHLAGLQARSDIEREPQKYADKNQKGILHFHGSGTAPAIFYNGHASAPTWYGKGDGHAMYDDTSAHAGQGASVPALKLQGAGAHHELDAINLNFDDDESYEPRLSFHVALTVCWAVARLKRRVLRRRQQRALGTHNFPGHGFEGRHASSPQTSSSSLWDMPGVRRSSSARPMTLTTAGMVCLAVAKLRRGRLRGLQFRGDQHTGRPMLHRNDTFQSALGDGANSGGPPSSLHNFAGTSPFFNQDVERVLGSAGPSAPPPPTSTQSYVYDSPPRASAQPTTHPTGAPVSLAPLTPPVTSRGNPLAAVSTWFARFIGSHVGDFVAVGVCAYAAGHLARPPALGA